ncbi:MAG: RluA family pseudouridine synthase [Chromatiales bacterium]|jgi:23S rRNA pseudouridine955/2504/2580 synthase|nr:RluA family pseudouridine synthase [Chromatiales bacterium]
MNNDLFVSVSLVTVEAEFEGQRIDNFLLRILKGVPRSMVYRRLRKGEVRVNKGRVRQSYRVKNGDVVRIPPMRRPEESAAGAVPGWLQRRLLAATLLENDTLLVVNKPSGVAVHGGSGESAGIIEALRVLRPDLPYLELAHRLDKATSGCLILAKRRSALRRIHAALRERTVDKTYLALVLGRWPRAVRFVDAALDKNVLRSGERMVRVSDDGKPSRTLFKVLDANDDISLISVKPVSGRTHQIRVHAASAGHPIAGDTKYGDAEFNAAIAKAGLKRLFLHAHSIVVKDLDLHVTAPLEESLQGVLDAVGLSA